MRFTRSEKMGLPAPRSEKARAVCVLNFAPLGGYEREQEQFTPAVGKSIHESLELVLLVLVQNLSPPQFHVCRWEQIPLSNLSARILNPLGLARSGKGFPPREGNFQGRKDPVPPRANTSLTQGGMIQH